MVLAPGIVARRARFGHVVVRQLARLEPFAAKRLLAHQEPPL